MDIKYLEGYSETCCLVLLLDPLLVLFSGATRLRFVSFNQSILMERVVATTHSSKQRARNIIYKIVFPQKEGPSKTSSREHVLIPYKALFLGGGIAGVP